MTRRLWFWLTVLACTLFASIRPALANGSVDSVKATREADFLAQAFTATHAKASGPLIHDYSTVDNQYLSQTELQPLAARIANELNLHHSTAKFGSAHGENLLELEGQQFDMTVQLYLSSFHQTGTPDSTVLVIRAQNSSGSLQQLTPEMNTLSKVLDRQHIIPVLSVYISGSLPNQLTQSETNTLIQQTLQSMHATLVERLQTVHETSISAYSPEGSYYLMTADKKMNLQVAAHYDSVHRQTSWGHRLSSTLTKSLLTT